MASFVLHVLIITCLFQLIRTHRLSLDAEPDSIAPGITNRLDLTCLVASTATDQSNSNVPNTDTKGGVAADPEDDDVIVDSVTTLSIYKVDDNTMQMLSALSESSPDTPRISDINSTVSGYIDAGKEPKAFLQVSWNYPDEDQEGRYICIFQGIDIFGMPVSFEQPATIMVRQPSAKEITDHMKELENLVTQQNNQIEHLKATNKNTTVWDQHLAVHEHNSTMMVRVANDLDNLQSRMGHLDAFLQGKLVNYRQLRSVGFTAQLASEYNVLASSVGEEDVLKFKRVLINIGDRYSPHTGIFTSLAGMFKASMNIAQTESTVVEVTIFHASAITGVEQQVCKATTKGHVSGSCSGLVQLGLGDKVYARITENDANSPTYLHHMSSFSLFGTYYSD